MAYPRRESGVPPTGARRLLSMGGGTLILALLVAAMRHVTSTACRVKSSVNGKASSTIVKTSSGCWRASVDVREQERRTLARELHDEVGQALTAVKMDIRIALRGEQLEKRTRSARGSTRAQREHCAACATCFSFCIRRRSTISVCRRR